MTVVGLIPARARGGKNLRIVAGATLVDWAVKSAQRATALDRVVVSTEDRRLGEAACWAWGPGHPDLHVVIRPPELAQDDTPDLPVVLHALRTLGLSGEADLVVLLRPTAPFRRPEEIDEVVGLMAEWREPSSIRSVIPARAHPRKCYREAGFQGLPYRALLPYTPNHAANAPRQGLEPVWQPVGFIDAVRTTWALQGTMEGPLIAAWPAPAGRALDIDDDEDLRDADFLARARGWRPGEIT